MISFLGKLFGRASADRRKVFFFRAAGRGRYADPMTICRRLADAEPNWEKLLATISRGPSISDDPDTAATVEAQWFAACARLIEVGRSVFDLSPMDDAGHGTTDAEVIRVIAEYLQFMARLLDVMRESAQPPARNYLNGIARAAESQNGKD